MNIITAACLVVAGLIHLLPLAGITGPGALERLYGMRITEPDLLIVLRHRALLFGLLGMCLVIAAFRPAWQLPVLGIAAVSAAGFIILALLTEGYSQAIWRVVIADCIALLALGLAAVVIWAERAGKTFA